MESYDLALVRAKIEEVDFVEAIDRILYSDEWFPTVARIIAVCDECARDRRLRQRNAAPKITAPRAPLVCPYCHGSRWVRLGGYDALAMQAGDEGSRVQPCPKCTTNRKHDPAKEAALIRREGGVPDPRGTDYMPDMEATTWRVPRDDAGRVDLDELYRQSRMMRGLDPNVDERPQVVSGWKTMGQRKQEDAPQRELVTVGAGEDDDDVPFD